MKILLDHCVTYRFRAFLSDHSVTTAAEAGLDRFKNGVLLRATASAGFDVLLTVDKSLRYQQNLNQLPVAVMIMRAVSNDIADLEALIPQVLAALEVLKPCTCVVIPPESA